MFTRRLTDTCTHSQDNNKLDYTHPHLTPSPAGCIPRRGDHLLAVDKPAARQVPRVPLELDDGVREVHCRSVGGLGAVQCAHVLEPTCGDDGIVLLLKTARHDPRAAQRDLARARPFDRVPDDEFA